ncbi:hypothetical protein YC2023_056462 [Brassica napus]
MTSSDSVKTSKKSGEITNLMTQLSSEIFKSLGETSKKEEVKTHLWGNLRNNGVQLKPTFLHCLLLMTVAVWDIRVGKSHALAFNAQKDVNVISSNRFFCQASSGNKQLTIWDLSLEKDEEAKAEFKAYTKEQLSKLKRLKICLLSFLSFTSFFFQENQGQGLEGTSLAQPDSRDDHLNCFRWFQQF